MKDYLLSIAMYSIKYAEGFGYKEEDVSNALGYVFRVYQDDVKEYSNQELSLLVAILSQYDEDSYKEYIDVFSSILLKKIIDNSKEPKDSLSYIKKIIKKHSSDKNAKEEDYLKLIKGE